MPRIRLTALVGALLLTACGDDQPLPPARPLTATAEQLAAIPGRKAGPHEVAIDALDWSVDGDTLKVRVVRPVGAGPFPLIVFSHGFASDVDEYDALLHHWASHGYLSIAPFHADGGGTLSAILASIRLGKGGLRGGVGEEEGGCTQFSGRRPNRRRCGSGWLCVGWNTLNNTLLDGLNDVRSIQTVNDTLRTLNSHLVTWVLCRRL